MISLRKPFRYSYKNAALKLIIINVIVFLLFRYTNLIPIDERYFAINVAGFISGKMFWQPFTYMFMHGSFSHLIFNMLGLYFFGSQIERALGTKEFLLMYFVIGVLSGLFSVIVYYFMGIFQMHFGNFPYAFLYSLVGASGAIYGILFAFAVFFPTAKIYVYFLLPVPAPILVIAYAIIEFFSQFGSSNVAHHTHLAGFGFSFLYIFIRMGINPIKVWKDAYRR